MRESECACEYVCVCARMRVYLSWSALRNRGRIIWRKLPVRSSLGWLFARLIDPFRRRLRKLCEHKHSKSVLARDGSFPG